MKLVTAVEMQRQFGRIREDAQRAPVGITNHGRESLVLLSAVEYKRLKSFEQETFHAWELDAQGVNAVANSKSPAEAEKFNDERVDKT